MQNEIIIITGMSGAGKSIALRAFEDIGYEAIDNIPLSILPLIVLPSNNSSLKLVVVVDIRNRDFTPQEFLQTFKLLKCRTNLSVKLLFLDCDDDVLQRRFTETRRKHPITSDRLITDSIKHEREVIIKLRDYADQVIDTSDLKTAELKNLIRANYNSNKSPLMSIMITSFSYKRGVPREADLVFDTRFLQNPFYNENLRKFTGCSKNVGEFIEKDPAFLPFFESLNNMIMPLIPLYYQEGKNYLTIAIGCTGGVHRSVYVAEKLKKLLIIAGYNPYLRHRELDV